MHQAERHHAVLRFLVGDRVPPDDGDPGGGRDVLTPLEHPAEHLQREVVDGPRNDVEPEDRSPPIAYTSDSAFAAAILPQS